jgi:hypothetical protein
MMTLIAAAAVAAAQPAPSVQMDAMHPEQHGSMNNDCCKDCCNKHGERDAHSPEAKPQRGR